MKARIKAKRRNHNPERYRRARLVSALNRFAEGMLRDLWYFETTARDTVDRFILHDMPS